MYTLEQQILKDQIKSISKSLISYWWENINYEYILIPTIVLKETPTKKIVAALFLTKMPEASTISITRRMGT